MDDKTTSSLNTNEYSFSEADAAPEAIIDEQSGDNSGYTEEKKLVSIKNINLRKLIIPGVIISGILLMYAVFNLYGIKKTRSLEQQKIQSQEGVSASPIVSAHTPIVDTAQQSSLPINNDQINKIQATVQQKIGDVEHTIETNNNQLASLSDAISKSQQDVSNINQNINRLNTEVEKILTEINDLKAKKQASPKTKKKVSKPMIAYHVRAIVPGRVWIESADGKGVTLRVGDNLDGYGTVEVISPEQGMVLMSNGSYIQYGVNDF